MRSRPGWLLKGVEAFGLVTVFSSGQSLPRAIRLARYVHEIRFANIHCRRASRAGGLPSNKVLLDLQRPSRRIWRWASAGFTSPVLIFLARSGLCLTSLSPRATALRHPRERLLATCSSAGEETTGVDAPVSGWWP